MQIITIKTRDVGDLEFTAPDAGGYVRCNDVQVCAGGAGMGSTLTCSRDTLEKSARSWYRAWRRNFRGPDGEMSWVPGQ